MQKKTPQKQAQTGTHTVTPYLSGWEGATRISEIT